MRRSRFTAEKLNVAIMLAVLAEEIEHDAMHNERYCTRLIDDGEDLDDVVWDLDDIANELRDEIHDVLPFNIIHDVLPFNIDAFDLVTLMLLLEG